MGRKIFLPFKGRVRVGMGFFVLGQTNKKIVSNGLQRKLRTEMTNAEKALWRVLRGRQVMGLKFRRQHPFSDYILDFVCLESKLVIEVDGGQHGDRAQYDEIRTRDLRRVGFRVLRFWNNEVLQEIEAVKETILKAVEEQKSHPLPNPPLEGEGVPLQSRHNSDTPERPAKTKAGISYTVIVLLGYCIIAFSEHAFGQASLPWLKSGESTQPVGADITESQLPLVRTRIEGSGETWVGQAVSLNVEVIVPSWFTGAPKFPELEVPNAVTLSPEAAVNFVVQSAGKTFSAQGQRYLIFPQVRGKYTVPSAKVEVSYAMPDGKPSSPWTLASAPIQFEARIPPGAEGEKYFLTTDRFQISQTLDRKLEGLKVGDSVTRTVEMTAEGTVGISLPPLKFEAPEGVRLYPGAPKVYEKAERGKIEATRTETATYVLEKEGRYTIPEIVIMWWNPQTKGLNKARLPAMELNVGENPAYNTETFASSQDLEEKPAEESDRTVKERFKTFLQWAGFLLGLFLLFLVLRRFLAAKGFSIGSYLAEKKRRGNDAEKTYFKRFRKACFSNDPKASFQALMSWLDRTNTQPVAPTLEKFVLESGMPELLKAGETLNRLLFAPHSETGPIEPRKMWSGKPLDRAVARARKIYARRAGRPPRSKQKVPCLNPRAG
jgi:very-short-patch-repair endonuclease